MKLMNGGQSKMPSGVNEPPKQTPPTSWLKDVASNPLQAQQAGIVRTDGAGVVDMYPYSQFYAAAAHPSAAAAYMSMMTNPSPTALVSRTITTSSDLRPLQSADKTHYPHLTSASLHQHSPSPKSSYIRPPPAEPGPPPVKRSKTSTNSVPHRPDYFHKGSVIQLATSIKQIEDLSTSDFEDSALRSPNLFLDSSTIVNISEDISRGTVFLKFSVGEPPNQIQATVEATLEHPFFVYNQGWSSVSPQNTLSYYNLECKKLKVGDRCVSLKYREDSSSGHSG